MSAQTLWYPESQNLHLQHCRSLMKHPGPQGDQTDACRAKILGRQGCLSQHFCGFQCLGGLQSTHKTLCQQEERINKQLAGWGGVWKNRYIFHICFESQLFAWPHTHPLPAP